MTVLPSRADDERCTGALEVALAWPPHWVRNGEPTRRAVAMNAPVSQAEIALRHFTPAGRDLLADVLRRAIQRGREGGGAP